MRATLQNFVRTEFVILSALAATVAGCSGAGNAGGSKSSSATAGRGSAKEVLCKHEVAEKFCPLCHPEIKNDPNVLLCKEHYDIPEEICTACHPELKAKYKTCPHELPPALCLACQNAKNGQKADGGESRVEGKKDEGAKP